MAKQRLLFITTLLISSFFASTSNSQTRPATVPKPVATQQYRRVDTVKNTDFSLNGQYRFMLSRSKSSYGAKLINPTRLDALWKSVNDTLRKERVELTKAKAKIAEQEKSISSLNGKVSGTENTLNEANAKVDEISFLGISFTKSTYNILVWSIIGVLAIALFAVIARSTKSILEAKHRTQLYDEISAEYQAYKAKANEQQRKLARELQDERNVIEEMKSRGR
ncbi:hypothetical protein [Pedobacter namyangjuensis]|uniref:hypothetical protein n=1 Tax=Pedobacter namyangjuensis TaxID=600626 RepID=UPI000DE55B7C|nr:hypothetical protein [Pedobacter namyangjuensis]